MTTRTEHKAVFLRGLHFHNHAWLKKQAKKHGYTLSGFVNHLIEKARKDNASHS